MITDIVCIHHTNQIWLDVSLLDGSIRTRSDRISYEFVEELGLAPNCRQEEGSLLCGKAMW
jgi:hypothetical protein